MFDLLTGDRTSMIMWPNFMERLRNVSIVSVLDMRKYDGTSIGRFPATNPDYPALITTRSELHKLLYEYAQELGITVEFNATVVDYYETDKAGGVMLSDGRKLEADVVVAADGVGSKACLLVSGYKDKPSSSGSAVYRVTYPVAVALENPVIAEWLADRDSYAAMFLGPDAYVVVGRSRNTLFHKTDWKAVSQNPQAIGKFVGDWLVKHDPESYVYENYAKCVNHLLMGVPFENTNAVPGYHYKPWTVSEVVTAYEEGTRLVDEGEWL
ncbi:putative fad binding domain protein [Neofusicoccum parvum UCRNP2]|uniref:Putative fad binding domain protein n=1 Tax=Botryosphaeria parva (strain UCR-NP2) TaxID=1287680 RepID=R1GFQ4_BOTPV|nr:putative fad binding domain protein [Neofusicoccum parvum UCRNP2]